MPRPTTQMPAAGWPRRLIVSATRWVQGLYHLGPAAPGPPRTEFTRLAVVQSLSSAGDAVMAVALAGSVFFDVSADAAQSRVALSLALTVAPFAIVGPLLGPLVERARGGRRAMAVGASAGRALACFFMAFWVHSLLLFPVTFFALVFSKLYLVTKAALVPGAVSEPGQLVLANSKLTVGGSLAGTAAGVLGAGLLAVLGPADALRADIVVYGLCAWQAGHLALVTRTRRPAAPPGRGREPEVAPGRGADLPACKGRAPAPEATAPEATAPGQAPAPAEALRCAVGPDGSGLPPGGLQLAAIATAVLRFSTGFVTLLLVFTFRRGGAALVWYGLALGASQVGNVAGALLAPRLRLRLREEWMLTGSSLVAGAVTLAAGLVAWGAHWAVAVGLAGAVGLAAGSGKPAFDSMVQRDVPSHVRARSFARFESLYQLSWAVGGLLAVLVPLPLPTGFTAVGSLGLAGAVAFAGGTVQARRGLLPAWFPGAVPRPGGARTHRSGPDRPAGRPGQRPPTSGGAADEGPPVSRYRADAPLG